jgi:hypothetical protein
LAFLLVVTTGHILAADDHQQKALSGIVVNNGIRIPRVPRPPRIEDFVSMRPAGPFANGGMIKIDQFKQRLPIDGAPISQRTEAYLGYDDKHFYAVLIAFDTEPQKIRARMGKREDIWADDVFLVILDTFNDRRRAYGFASNARGVQAEGVWTEGADWDFSWDTVWESHGQLTPQGYVVLISIPFRSMRFPAGSEQHWGIMLDRDIPRNDEQSFWPQYSNHIDGRLNQEGQLEGIERVSPGRNMQFIPYVSMRSFRAPDQRDPYHPFFSRRSFQGSAGLDSKFVLKDSLVLDTTINPDFAQVESDDPQVTANRRFEVYFPEKRPFFLENAGFFQTPIELVFTRRIANPSYGVRLTGKTGPYAVGVMVADDRSPGAEVPDTDPLAGTNAKYTIARVNRDIFQQSTVGLIYTDREYAGTFNRIGGIDTRIKFDDHWIATGQAVVSSNRETDGSYSAGPSFRAEIARHGRKFNYTGTYSDTSTGFITYTGFFRRPDYRFTRQVAEVTWHPKKSLIYAHGPVLNTFQSFDHSTGTHLENYNSVTYNVLLRGQTTIAAGYTQGGETLRPLDFASLPGNQHYSEHQYTAFVGSDHFSKLGIRFSVERDKVPNFAGLYVSDLPPLGIPPQLGTDDSMYLSLIYRPIHRLRIDTNYTFERLHEPGQSVFNNHIVRSKANIQFTRALSLRLIETYDSLLTNPLQTPLYPTKRFNTDFLVTYLLHPGTAVYVGCNSNLSNLTRDLGVDSSGTLLRTRNDFINDSHQFFVKISYLFRF